MTFGLKPKNNIELITMSRVDEFSTSRYHDSSINSHFQLALIEFRTHATKAFNFSQKLPGHQKSEMDCPESGVADEKVYCQNEEVVIDLRELLSNEDDGGIWTQLSGSEDNFDMQKGTFSIKGQEPGIYAFVYGFEEDADCPEVFTVVNIEILKSPKANAGPDANIDCDHPHALLGPLEFQRSDLIYEWYNANGDLISSGDQNISVKDKGIYILYVSDLVSMCSDWDTAQVIALESPPKFNYNLKDIICYGERNGEIGFVDLVGGDGTYVLRIEGDTSLIKTVETDHVFTNISPGDYDLFVQSAGCYSDSIFITINDGNDLNFNLNILDTDFQLGDEFYLEIDTDEENIQNINRIIWSIEDSILCDGTYNLCKELNLIPRMTSILEVKLFDGLGCIQSQSRFFRRKEIDNIYIPNIFSPKTHNGDEKLEIFGNYEIESIEEYKIFDRWGNLIFEIPHSVELNSGFNQWWDGTFDGNPLLPGVYVLKISYFTNNDPGKLKSCILEISLIE